MRTQVLLIGGRSGVGKTTAAIALHELLVERGVQHALIEGDNLDLANPAPHVEFPTFKLAERNLAAMWGNYRELGYRRLIYTNTASVIVAGELTAAMGDDPHVVAVLLRASEETGRDRLLERRRNEISLREIEHSASTAVRLDNEAGTDVHRLGTDGLAPSEVASRLLEIAGWITDRGSDH